MARQLERHPLERLTATERETLESAFHLDDFLLTGEWKIRGTASDNLIREALTVRGKLRKLLTPDILPKHPPQPADWKVWHLKCEEGWTYARLVAEDSPAWPYIRGEDPKRAAMRRVKRVRDFRRAEPFWFNVIRPNLTRG